MQSNLLPPPCVLHEDDHLLVVNKPAGLNTHSPAPFAGEGIYDWLRQREPRWARLAIVHRLDKETSGVMVFGKTQTANRSLTEQFTRRSLRKHYRLLTSRGLRQPELVAATKLRRVGERYASGASGEPAETLFRNVLEPSPISGSNWVLAEPRTGRTHQIRVHAAENGFPILGDTLYGGAPFPRLCLHASEITLRHPASGIELTFCAPPDFAADARLQLRAALIDERETSACRILHGAADGRPGWFVERLGDYLLSFSEGQLTPAQRAELARLSARFRVRGAYHKILNRQVRRAAQGASSPQLVLGEAAPARFAICENGLRFELSFQEGYSVGLFLDQRDNRRRFLTGRVAADFSIFPHDASHPKPELLNGFAYTCGFSVCAARAGARVTSLDLSKKYLEWGQRNFVLNGLDPAAHEFVFGDACDWLRRLAKKRRTFDAIALDPPTFSQSKTSGVFRVENDLGTLVIAALPLLRRRGVLLCSTNAADWDPEHFLAGMTKAVAQGGRRILHSHFAGQPPDFPVTRAEPAYLKTVWLRLD